MHVSNTNSITNFHQQEQKDMKQNCLKKKKMLHMTSKTAFTDMQVHCGHWSFCISDWHFTKQGCVYSQAGGAFTFVCSYKSFSR